MSYFRFETTFIRATPEILIEVDYSGKDDVFEKKSSLDERTRLVLHSRCFIQRHVKLRRVSYAPSGSRGNDYLSGFGGITEQRYYTLGQHIIICWRQSSGTLACSEEPCRARQGDEFSVFISFCQSQTVS